jgi:hypothetical protein
MKLGIKRRDAEDAEIRGEKLFLLCVSLRSLQCHLATSSHSAKIFYEEARNPRMIGMNSWFPGFLIENVFGCGSAALRLCVEGNLL